MRHSLRLVMVLVVGGAVALACGPGAAQGPGGAPGMPMQRMGPARGQSNGLGAPGAPMARMGRSPVARSASPATPTRRSYSGMAGLPGVMSSQNYSAQNLAGQARGAGMQRSSASVVGGVTRGMLTVPSNQR